MLVSSPRRPVLSGHLAETDWHLAFRTPQSFQAEYTGPFLKRERERERLVTWIHTEKQKQGGERMKNSLMITLKRRMIWRGNKTVIEVKRAAGSQQLDQGQTWLKKQKRRESEYVVEDRDP